MSRSITQNHLLLQVFWLLAFSALLTSQIQGQPFTLTHPGTPELVCSSDLALPGEWSSAALEVEDSQNLLPTFIPDIAFTGPDQILVRYTPGRQHSWTRSLYFAHLTRPPPAHLS